MIPLSPTITVVPVDPEPQREFIPTHASLDDEGRISLGGYWKTIITDPPLHVGVDLARERDKTAFWHWPLDGADVVEAAWVGRRRRFLLHGRYGDGYPLFLVGWRAELEELRDPERPQIECSIETILLLIGYSTAALIFGAVPFFRWLASIAP